MQRRSSNCRPTSGRSAWGTRYYDGDSALIVELWLHRVADDFIGQDSGFRSGTPQRVLTMQVLRWQKLVNSSELCATDLHLPEVMPLQLDVVTHGGRQCKKGYGSRTVKRRWKAKKIEEAK